MTSRRPHVAVIGGGPAGLMAAEAAAQTAQVSVFDAMPSFGRKFLLAGKGGLNLTHSDTGTRLYSRYQPPAAPLEHAITAFDSSAVRAWAGELGIATFTGSSGRIFPVDLKAAPLLRRWLRRLRTAGVAFYPRHRWRGWDQEQQARFDTADGNTSISYNALVLACGGASWPRLGSDGAWLPLLSPLGISIAPLAPSNCGFECAWSAHLRERYAGAPVKTVSARVVGADDAAAGPGELVVTDYGIEGTLVYTLSGPLREALNRTGGASLELDLAPDRSVDSMVAALARQPPKRTRSERLRRALGVSGVKLALVNEYCRSVDVADDAALARTVKALPLTLTAARPLARAISTAGGIRMSALNDDFMLRDLPGVFAAGEMLDWEAATGGYLMTGCLATGRRAGFGAAAWAHTGSPTAVRYCK